MQLANLALFVLSAGVVRATQDASLPQLQSPLGPVVNLGYAAFAGNSTSPTGELSGPVTFFGNIPFAQPPLGNLRFRAPQPLDESIKNGGNVPVSDARNFGPACIQQPAVVGVGSEDCLQLNVWKPSNATEGDNLPVVVYIYVGGFFAGTTQGFPMYDWVNQHPNGIVAVSMSYRLNTLGFLSGSAVRANGDENAGLLDQRAAIEWVQRHISKFGGNPDEITIDGESAGGASVVMQVVAYGGAQGAPFKRAIAQSIGFGPTANSAQMEMYFGNITDAAGCPNTGEAAMTCLRSASIGAIVSAINHVPLGMVSPVVDGKFLPDFPSRLIASGNFSTVDFIGGHCTNDGRTFVGGSPSQITTEEDVATIPFKRWPGVTNSTIQQALKLYPSPDTPGSPFTSQYDRAATMAGDIIFTCMDYFLSEQMSTVKGVEDVFAFRWNAPDPVLLAAAPYEGTMHTSDIYFLFDGTNSAMNAGFTFTPFNTTEASLSAAAIAYWTSFTATGDPSAEKLASSPAWSPFATAEQSNRMRIVLTEGTTSGTTASVMEALTPEHIERCQFWMQANVTAQTTI
ncbi:Alpha/Beta hydrolase protein [Hygrophoropsis aurantiaca]|uniref:Alpha/Beta hydrolase protein n=1 Tax=Hygrophoropsis aurantiaca TaxID=72124 RepID=A0ACB7ZW84_9AGAM|nr:Alpha/Beta hydrolase protein [Hygrophoropsis aurantiaca]